LKGADLWTGISERLASASPAQLAHRSTPTSRAGHGGARTPSLA